MPEARANSVVELEKHVFDRVVDHIRNDSTDKVDRDLLVPIAHFVSPDRLAAEIALLKRLPVVAAHSSEIPNPGDFVTREILGTPVIITRTGAGRVAIYFNMCRHRGGIVESQPAGRRRHFVCQYHGWAYDRENGHLRSVPHSDYFEDLDPRCNALRSFKTEERHGLIFVDFSNDPDRSLAGYLGEKVEATMAAWKLGESRLFLDKSYDVNCNWKLVLDGAIDSLHVEFLHARSFAGMMLPGAAVFEDYGRHGQLFQARRRLAEMVKAGDMSGGNSRYVASDMLIYPNSLMIGSPDHVEFWTVWPVVGHPDRARVDIRFFVRPEIMTEKMEERVRRSWGILENAATTEDWPMEVSMQKNIAAAGGGEFRYGLGEVSSRHLHEQLARDLDDA